MLGLAGAVTAVLATGSPAVAQEEGTADINQGNVPTTAENYDEQECDGPLADLPPGQDGWHFVLPGAANSFVSITLTFDTPDGEVTVEIDSTDPDNPSTGDGWSGYIDGMHAWLVTDAGWTLTGGTATVDSPSGQDTFNLSHTCPAETTPTPTPSETPTPTPSETPTPTPSETPTPAPTETPTPAPTTPAPPTPTPTTVPANLPVTGGASGGIVLLGVLLLAGGGALLLAAHRRRIRSTPAGS